MAFCLACRSRKFFADFTGSSDGRTSDPSIERKLQRLLGGPTEMPGQSSSGWSRRAFYGHIAGYTPDLDHKVPALLPTGTPIPCATCGYGFITHSAYIAEDLNDGKIISVTVEHEQKGCNVAKYALFTARFLSESDNDGSIISLA
jgi:hypothetical protein